MRQLILAMAHCPLLDALTELANRYDATITSPENFADLVFNDPVAIVLDPFSLPTEVWQTYVDYLIELGSEDSTPLVIVLPRDGQEPPGLPKQIAAKPKGTLTRCYTDEIAEIAGIVEEAMLGTRNQWHITTPECTAPGILDVEETYIRIHMPDDFVVSVTRPADNAASMSIFGHMAEWAGLDTIDWAGAAFLTFTFPTQEDAQRFAARLPAGMATLYARGQYVDVNC